MVPICKETLWIRNKAVKTIIHQCDDDDDALLQSRLKLIEFPNSFLGQENKELKDALMSEPAYQEALLAWAVNGAFRWYNSPKGLTPPTEVIAATEKARNELDHVQQWLDECCNDAPESRTPNAELYQSYTQWCDDNGVTSKKKRTFSSAMKAKGYKAGMWHQGVSVLRGFIGIVISQA